MHSLIKLFIIDDEHISEMNHSSMNLIDNEFILLMFIIDDEFFVDDDELNQIHPARL